MIGWAGLYWGWVGVVWSGRVRDWGVGMGWGEAVRVGKLGDGMPIGETTPLASVRLRQQYRW